MSSNTDLQKCHYDKLKEDWVCICDNPVYIMPCSTLGASYCKNCNCSPEVHKPNLITNTTGVWQHTK